MNLDNFVLESGISIQTFKAMKYLNKIKPDVYRLEGKTYYKETRTFMVFSSKDKHFYKTFYVRMKPFKWQNS